MLSTVPLFAAILPLALASPLTSRGPVASYVATCNAIQKAISSASVVSWPGSKTYTSDFTHWVPNVQASETCTVQPGSVADIIAILGVLGKSTTPFAVKGGGHTGSPLFSSSNGVTIVMSRFNEVTYHKNNQTADVGAGNLWDNVYTTLEPYGVNVIGGRIESVGVAGFTLGGGYSWLTNRYGLSSDSVLAYSLVTPTGQFLHVTATSYPDLFWALKGGFNNYGIVTGFTFKTVPQGKTWGGLIQYPASSIPAVEAAIMDWVDNSTDEDAEIVAAFIGQNKTMSSTVLCFYNGPAPPKKNNPFSKLLSIPQTSNTLGTRGFYEQILAVSPPYANTARQRGSFGSPRVGNITLPIIQTAVKQVELLTANAFEPGAIFSAGMEPFITKNILKPLSAGSWPHAQMLAPTTLNAYWSKTENDGLGYGAIDKMNAAVNVTAAAEYPLDDLFVYPNYAIQSQVTLEMMYGPNLKRATEIAAKYDPKKVMTRSGGYIFQQK